MNPFDYTPDEKKEPDRTLAPVPGAGPISPMPPAPPEDPPQRVKIREAPRRETVVDWAQDHMELLHFGTDARDGNSWCLEDAFQGVQIFGGTGSGKSTGSGQALARAFIRNGLGGLVLTAKRDEVEVWRQYLKEDGHRPESDLVVLSPASGFKFNFLSYAFHYEGAAGSGSGRTENLVNLFCAVLEAAEKKTGGGGGANDSFWQRTLRQLLRNAIDLSILALRDVDLETLQTIINTAPQTLEVGRLTDPQERLRASACLALIDEASRQKLTPLERHDLELTRVFWEREFPALAIETRSVIVTTFTSMADCFLRGTLYDLFCTELSTEILPERCWDQRKIIVLDLPVKEYYDLGQFAQVLYKYLWQRAVERRVPVVPASAGGKADPRPIRPVFLWADEAQFFANSYDSQFQSTARSSRACTVYLTQNLPSYQAVMGGAEARAQADMFLGNLVTKIFHANGDSTTNTWASEMIGRSRRQFRQTNLGGAPVPNAPSGGLPTLTEQIAYSVEPQIFTTLRRGGRRDGVVDSIIFQSGRRWTVENQVQNYIRHSFEQGPPPA